MTSLDLGNRTIEVVARDEKEAIRKAKEQFRNTIDGMVHSFEKVIYVDELTDMHDGTYVYIVDFKVR